MSHGGKGSNPRPFSISQEEFSNNYDTIFGKNKKTKGNKQGDETILNVYNDERLVSKFDKLQKENLNVTSSTNS